MLEAIPTVVLADTVERRIREYIKASGLNVGDPIPGELELARQLDVSRNVVREALSRLRMLGLVQSRKRRGMILANPDVFAGLERILDAAVLDEPTARDLFEMRIVLELGLAEIVVARVQEDDLDALASIVALETAAVNRTETRVECDIAFHARLYRISGNRMLERFQSVLGPYFMQSCRAHPVRGPIAPWQLHSGLLEALRQKDAAAFRAAMLAHLGPLLRSMGRGQTKGVDESARVHCEKETIE